MASSAIAGDVAQAANDKQQIQPMLNRLGRLPAALGKPATLLADSGYFSAANVTACGEAQITPLIAPGRQRHHRSWKDRFAAAPAEPDAAGGDGASTGVARRQASLCLRKQTPEPVFGIIKAVMGFRQFSLRGLAKVRGEWTLVTLAWNVRRILALTPA